MTARKETAAHATGSDRFVVISTVDPDVCADQLVAEHPSMTYGTATDNADVVSLGRSPVERTGRPTDATATGASTEDDSDE